MKWIWICIAFHGLLSETIAQTSSLSASKVQEPTNARLPGSKLWLSHGKLKSRSGFLSAKDAHQGNGDEGDSSSASQHMLKKESSGANKHMWMGAGIGAGLGFVVTQKFRALLDPSGFCDFQPFDFPKDCFCSIASTAGFGIVALVYLFTDPGRLVLAIKDHLLTTDSILIVGGAVLGAVVGKNASEGLQASSITLPISIGYSRFGSRFAMIRWKI